MAKEHKDFVVGLDIGTFKMKVVVAELNPQAQVLPRTHVAVGVVRRGYHGTRLRVVGDENR